MITKIQKYINWRWNCEGGYKEFLFIAFPLILSTSSWSLEHFIDRMFLTWYSPATVAAAMPSGMLNFIIISLFLGTVGYVDTFVAQYYGAKMDKDIGPIVWQGVYLSIIGSLVLALTIPFAGNIFALFGHTNEIRDLETSYYRILCFGAFPVIASSALAGFYAGRGKTWIIMWVNFISTLICIVFDYILIFGKYGFPELGINGAAISNVIAGTVGFLIYLVAISKTTNIAKYNTLSIKPSLQIIKRIFKFGFPNGVQFLLDMAGFTTFVMIVGKLGTDNLAATNIALNINSIAFMPIIGCGIAVSILVGKYIGMNKADFASRSAYSGFHLTILYIFTIASLFYFFPNIFILPFTKGSNPKEIEAMIPTITFLLKFVAVYSIFDAMSTIFASAIKGAGDTKFVMYMLFFVSFFVLVIPSYLVVFIFGKGLYYAWAIASIYVSVLGIAFYLRFLQGKWKSMSVIESKNIDRLHANIPEDSNPFKGLANIPRTLNEAID
ncbi:MAG: MATE family efflux transporter [Elusimicrobia bacterium]|nr:MATE family efflux transporter [Candidatus Liberimonas magnetica]